MLNGNLHSIVGEERKRKGEKRGHYSGETEVATGIVSAGGPKNVVCPQDLLCLGGSWCSARQEDPWKGCCMGKWVLTSFWLTFLLFDWCQGALVTDQDPPTLATV